MSEIEKINTLKIYLEDMELTAEMISGLFDDEDLVSVNDTLFFLKRSIVSLKEAIAYCEERTDDHEIKE